MISDDSDRMGHLTLFLRVISSGFQLSKCFVGRARNAVRSRPFKKWLVPILLPYVSLFALFPSFPGIVGISIGWSLRHSYELQHTCIANHKQELSTTIERKQQEPTITINSYAIRLLIAMPSCLVTAGPAAR